MKVIMQATDPLLHDTVYLAGEIVRLVPSQQQAEIRLFDKASTDTIVVRLSDLYHETVQSVRT